MRQPAAVRVRSAQSQACSRLRQSERQTTSILMATGGVAALMLGWGAVCAALAGLY